MKSEIIKKLNDDTYQLVYERLTKKKKLKKKKKKKKAFRIF